MWLPTSYHRTQALTHAVVLLHHTQLLVQDPHIARWLRLTLHQAPVVKWQLCAGTRRTAVKKQGFDCAPFVEAVLVMAFANGGRGCRGSCEGGRAGSVMDTLPPGFPHHPPERGGSSARCSSGHSDCGACRGCPR